VGYFIAERSQLFSTGAGSSLQTETLEECRLALSGVLKETSHLGGLFWVWLQRVPLQ